LWVFKSEAANTTKGGLASRESNTGSISFGSLALYFDYIEGSMGSFMARLLGDFARNELG
jgi:hypothetical protein